MCLFPDCFPEAFIALMKSRSSPMYQQPVYIEKELSENWPSFL